MSACICAQGKLRLKRILNNTRWAEQSGLFLAEVRIEGIDRFGILQEIIQMISMHLAIDIRKLDIEAEEEVFHCDLAVRVHDTKVLPTFAPSSEIYAVCSARPCQPSRMISSLR